MQQIITDNQGTEHTYSFKPKTPSSENERVIREGIHVFINIIKAGFGPLRSVTLQSNPDVTYFFNEADTDKGDQWHEYVVVVEKKSAD